MSLGTTRLLAHKQTVCDCVWNTSWVECIRIVTGSAFGGEMR